MSVEIDAIQSAKSIGWTDALLSRLAANSVGLGARLSITAPANSSALSSTGYSLTGSNASSMIDLAGTLNTTGSPAIIKVAISNTASGATTKFLSFLAGASGTTEVFSVDKTGVVNTEVGIRQPSLASNYLTVTSALGNPLFHVSSAIGAALGAGPGGSGVHIGAGGTVKWNNTADPTGSGDLFIHRDAANTLALRNSTSAQAFNVYGTYTSGSVYERGAVYADSNGFNIAHQQLGSTKRPVRILGHDLASAEAVSALEINQTWNTSGNPVGLKMAITNTASGATAKFLSCLAGASGTTEILAIDKTGRIIGDGANPYLELSQANGSRLQYGVNNYFFAGGSSTIGMGANGLSLIGTLGTAIVQTDAANTLALRNSTSAQAFNIYNTYTSGSVYERGFMRWVSNVLEIGTEHVGASARDIVLKTNNTTRLTIGSSGAATFSSSVAIGSTSPIIFTGRVYVTPSSDGVLRLENNAGGDFNRLQFGGTTSSFPSLKRSSTVLQSRLADDSDFAPLQGQLRSHANATSETVTPTHTLRLFDAAGTEYRVPAIAV